ncbi:magnesium and cobalt transport protein CorA [Rehaibacterium terrae]|jgi:magnesium transporter|uniref:Magnesium transporter n=1 Tax=Rehaibacterium terrae TaxID=1341696 RepID=A0A7W7XZ68_9GAMM|nr:magnesium and cobalt transport protein CorA [Rehaibacterium terrae]MBB5015159.1 magnesium transporter [Rehaibacterium terrae]
MSAIQAAGIVNCVAYPADGSRRELPVAGIGEFLARERDGFVWVGLYEPDEPLLAQIQAEFGLHELAVEDAHHAHQRPKIEAYGDSLFIALHTAQLVDGSIRFGETHVFLGKRYLVTVRHGASLTYAPARARCEQHPELLRLGPSYALYAVLDYVVDNLQPIVREFQDELNELEQAIFAETFRRETIQRLYRLKYELTKMRLAVAPLQDILGQLVHLHPTLVREEMRLHFRDVFDHALRVNEAIDTLREMVTAAMTVNLSLVTVGQGEVVKRLAGWAALVAVPTLIASWYGMNFEHMPELAGDYSYYVVTGVTVLSAGLLYRLLKRARWL